MADYEGNGLAAFNDARSRGWGGSVTLADLEKLSAGNPIAHGIAAVWPDAPPSRMDQAYQTSIDRWKQLGKDAFFAPANSLKAFMDQPTFNNALGVMPMGGIGKMPIMPPTGIRAYHGSPYDFDKFDLSKIGTGEGAQSYGHGLYFAENPTTAQSYRDTLKTYKSKLPDDVLSLPPEMRQAVTTHARTDVDAATAAKRAQYMSSPLRQTDIDKVTDMVQRIRDAERGRMYEVNINAKPEQFLDWDRQLPLDSSARAAALDTIKRPGLFTSEPERTLRATSRDKIEGSPALTGQELYGALSRRIGGGNYRDSQASDVLRDAGIPGIRYMDQGSRAAPIPGRSPAEVMAINGWQGDPAATIRSLRANYGSSGNDAIKLIQGGWSPPMKPESPRPTSNYVLFNDKIIDIMKKWGIAGAAMPLAANEYDGRF